MPILFSMLRQTAKREALQARRRISISTLFASLLFTLAFVLIPDSFGQGITGSINGTVTDPSGAAVSGATVTVRQVDTNSVHTVTTSDVGSYTVTQLAPGTYSVKVDKSGFEGFQRNDLILQMDQVAKVDARLFVGSEQQIVNVSSESPIIQTETSSVGLVVDSETIQNTPLNGHLSVLGLLSLAPGVQGISATAQSTLPNRGVTFAVGAGQRNSYGGVGFTLDGVTSMQVSLQRGLPEIPPLDAVSEFKVISSGSAGEFTQPAQVVVVSKGGGNNFHGEVLWFHRGKGTSAKSYFAGAQPRPQYQRDEYGGNLSGPIRIPKLYNGKDRSFFFFAFEGYRLEHATSVNSSQPSLEERNGDFSCFLPGGSCTPTTILMNPVTGAPFPGNKIPSAMFNQVDVQLQNLLFPTPTQPGIGVNTFELIPITDNVTRYSLRIDHKINERNDIHGTFLKAFYGPNPVAGTSSKAGGESQDGEHYTNFIVDWTHTFSPTLLIDTHASYLHLPIYRTAQNNNVGFSSIIPGLGPQLIEGAPSISITNIANPGESASHGLEQIYQANTALTKVLAKHTIKTGFSYLFDNSWNLSGGTGSYSFTTRYTGVAYADFLLGYPTSTGKSTPSSTVTRVLSSQYGMYFQDDYRPTPKLTLNAGLRYDLQWFENNPYGTAGLYDPSVKKVVVFADAYPASTIPAFIPNTVLASSVGLPTNLFSYLGQATTNIAPRFGFAYQVFPNTVIRGAVGLFYNLLPPSYITGAFTNYPFVGSISYSQPAGPPQITMNAPFASTGAYGANPSVSAQHSTVNPYTEQYNLAVEHQLKNGLDFRIGYVGQRNIHQNNSGGSPAPDINLPSPGPGVVQNRRPVQPFSSISLQFDPIYYSTMNSLQVGVHKRFSHGFMVNGEWQWIRILGLDSFQDPASIGDSYGNISANTPQTLRVSYSYALPFGQGQTFFGTANSLVNRVISGWKISGITSFQTGQAFSVSYTAPGSPVGLVSGRANRVPGVPLYPAHKSLTQWFNPAAFTAPANFTYGNSAYNMLWGPNYQSWDMNLQKNIVWKDRYRLQLRGEAFNVFNHPSFGNPSANISNPATIGRITSQTGDSRTIEFAAKLSF